MLTVISLSIVIEHVCVHHCLLKEGCLEQPSHRGWNTLIEPSAGLGRSDNVARFMPLALESIVGM